jgi:hypothetical protein
MATLSQRFGVGDPLGARSSEWVVMWKSTASDIYLAARTLGGTLKASIHESGRCHVRAPDTKSWRSPGAAPHFLDVWSINPQSKYEFPFGIVIPEPELRAGKWPQYRDRGTVWLPVAKGNGIEVAIFLTRASSDQSNALKAAGWHTVIVNTALPDGRHLLVAAGNSIAHIERQAELENLRKQLRSMLVNSPSPSANPRALLFTVDGKGTRRFVEVAVND